MSEIIIGKDSGFCFGVKRAAETVEKCIVEAAKGEEIYTLGKLIHNDVFNARLADRGVSSIPEEDIEKIAAGSSEEKKVTLVLRAHGVTVECEEKLTKLSAKYPNFRFVDCTCPFVKKIHRIAEKNSGDDKMLVLLGHKGHPETEGILSRFNGEKYIFATADEINEASEKGILRNCSKKMVISAAQTTQKSTEWKKSKKILKYLCTNPIFFDTICNVTESRQKEAEILSKECDSMIVIGGRESANTAKLYQICKENCNDTV